MRHWLPSIGLCAALALSLAGAVDPPAEPAKISWATEPQAAAPGSKVRVELRLSPQPGIKINRHPKISLKVAEQAGLARAAEASVGNDAPPPPDRLDENYYKDVDPLTLELQLDSAIPAGRHEIPAKLRYFYCVAASGYCAPQRADVRIPITVR